MPNHQKIRVTLKNPRDAGRCRVGDVVLSSENALGVLREFDPKTNRVGTDLLPLAFAPNFLAARDTYSVEYVDVAEDETDLRAPIFAPPASVIDVETRYNLTPDVAQVFFDHETRAAKMGIAPYGGIPRAAIRLDANPARIEVVERVLGLPQDDFKRVQEFIASGMPGGGDVARLRRDLDTANGQIGSFHGQIQALTEENARLRASSGESPAAPAVPATAAAPAPAPAAPVEPAADPIPDAATDPLGALDAQLGRLQKLQGPKSGSASDAIRAGVRACGVEPVTGSRSAMVEQVKKIVNGDAKRASAVLAAMKAVFDPNAEDVAEGGV